MTLKAATRAALQEGRSIFVVGLDAEARAKDIAALAAAIPKSDDPIVLIDPNGRVPVVAGWVRRRPVEHGVLTTFRAVLRMAPACVVIPEAELELFDAIYAAVETGTQIVTSFEAAGAAEGQAWFEAQAADRAGVPVDVVRESLKRRPPLYVAAVKER